MSIAPPSDIVLDVAKAADPAQVKAAAAKLASLAGSPAADIDFSSVLDAQTKPLLTAPARPSVHAAEISRGHALRSAPGSPYSRFEAVVLQNFLQDVLPKSSELFGDTFSADAYRSMLAEQVAAQVAKSGRLGIAAGIERKEASLHPHAAPAQAPAAELSATIPLPVAAPTS